MRLPPALPLLAALLTAAPAPAADAPAAPPPAKRPNVLLIITDDQGWGDLSFHGNDKLSTPNIDKLAAGSVRFDRFYVSPLCAPTRASLLTGRYSLRTGAKGVSSGEETMRPEEVTLAEIFRDAGYRTGLFGKWHNGEHFPYDPRGQGFQESFGYNLGHWNNYFDTTLRHNGRPVKTKGYITDVVTDAALRFLDAAGDGKPFLCYLSLPTPHSPFQVPDAYFDRARKRGLDDKLACVYGMCENIDDNVGRMLRKLEDLRLRDDTVVVFLTDNGPNGARFNGGMKGTKGSLHEGGSRVPFFVCWPGKLEPRLVEPIAAHIDVLPTLVELCGLPAPKTLPLDGRSLVPLLHGKAEGWPERTLFTQHRLLPAGKADGGAVRTQRFRLVAERGRWQLFDMQADPGQTRDVAGDHPETARGLREAFEKWYADVRTGADGYHPAIPVGHDEEDPVELPTPRSEFSGGLKFAGRHPNNNWLVGWTRPEAAAKWELDVARGGAFEVTLLYSCEAKDAGSRLSVSVAGGSAVEVVVPAAPAKRVPSPDRVPREEVYEMEWAPLTAGTLTLPAGRTTLTVKPLSIAGGPAMELKAVVLKRR